MPSLKRDRLLSDLELKRVETRSSLDQHTRATNDVRVKRKLAAWLKGVNDVVPILANLPRDQLRKLIADEDIFQLLFIASIAMDIRDFNPIAGDVKHPETWIVQDENGINIRPASDEDVIRAIDLDNYINSFKDTLGEKNPIHVAKALSELENEPAFRDKVSDEERRGIRRIKEAYMKKWQEHK